MNEWMNGWMNEHIKHNFMTWSTYISKRSAWIFIWFPGWQMTIFSSYPRPFLIHHFLDLRINRSFSAFYVSESIQKFLSSHAKPFFTTLQIKESISIRQTITKWKGKISWLDIALPKFNLFMPFPHCCVQTHIFLSYLFISFFPRRSGTFVLVTVSGKRVWSWVTSFHDGGHIGFASSRQASRETIFDSLIDSTPIEILFRKYSLANSKTRKIHRHIYDVTFVYHKRILGIYTKEKQNGGCFVAVYEEFLERIQSSWSTGTLFSGFVQHQEKITKTTKQSSSIGSFLGPFQITRRGCHYLKSKLVFFLVLEIVRHNCHRACKSPGWIRYIKEKACGT